MTELLDPRVDFVFKRIFGTEENKDVLLAFLNRIFEESGNGERLTEIVLLDPHTGKDAPEDKQSIMDIWALTDNDELIDIEMQLLNNYDIEKRTLYYWARRYASQLKKGHSYKELKKCVTINILNYMLLRKRNEQYHHVFHLYEDRSRIKLIDDIEVHVIELPKVPENEVLPQGGLRNWLLFLKNLDKSQWEALSMNESKLKKAMEALEYLSQDEGARRLYEARQKYLHDEASKITWMNDRIQEGLEKGLAEGLAKGHAKGLEEGHAEGHAEGKVEGERQKALEIARNMLQLHIEIVIIAQASGLSESEVQALSLR